MSKTAMFQTYVVRDTEKYYPGRPKYRVISCFPVTIDLADEYYEGRKVWRCHFKAAGVSNFVGGKVVGCVFFGRNYQLQGDYISIRAALGIKKAGRA